MSDPVINLDRFKSKRKSVSGKPTTDPAMSLEATKRLFAKVPFEDVLDRRQDRTYSPHTRLLIYLTVKSHGGKREVRLTNTMAAEAGLTRVQKSRSLHHLELYGHVTVERSRQEAPRVTVRRRWP